MIRTSTVDTARGEFGARITDPDPSVPPQPPVVCVHGFPDDASTFDDIAAGLAAHGHPVTAVYLRGYAPSPLTGAFSIDELSEDLAQIAATVGQGNPVHFIGHDYGAQIGFAALGDR